ncbi:MAG: histidine phosphatase family protein [Thermomicrobiales bacterium]
MTILHLVRHGSTPWTEDGNRYTGSTDVPLSPTGREEVERTGRGMATLAVDAVMTSPLLRAAETASTIAWSHGLEPVMEPGLAEIDFGQWEGLRRAEILLHHPQAWETWRQRPEVTRAGTTGETGADVVVRALAALDGIAATFPDGEVIAVTHNTLIRLVLVAILGAPLKSYGSLVIEPGSVTQIELLRDADPRIIATNRVLVHS